ncbi:unnamed protein product [Cuscuta europaea]|uniref:Uncharacterized protein n=1 Tax=Cuscuta europaea TaxID=41803 RepID=A0A9P0YWX4_CUSEU|nr:unnamed protein product [Cuscuta europaea]
MWTGGPWAIYSINPIVLNSIISIITNNFHGPWYSFKHVDANQQEHWWRLFERKYDCDPCYNNRIKKRFRSRAYEWLSKNIGRARRQNKKPEWICDGDWMLLKEYWGSDSFKKKSAAGKKTRNSQKAKESQYRGGRIPVSRHVEKTTKDLNRAPLKIEVYEKVYVPKELKQKYNELKVEAESQGKSYEVDYRGRRYGTGSEAESLSGSIECSSRHSGPTQQEIDALIETQVEARFA